MLNILLIPYRCHVAFNSNWLVFDVIFTVQEKKIYILEPIFFRLFDLVKKIFEKKIFFFSYLKVCFYNITFNNF